MSIDRQSIWRDCLDRVAAAGEEVFKMLPDAPSEQLRAEADRILAMTFAQGYWMLFHGDAAHPDWIPFISFMIPSGAINPDTSYDCCRIDDGGTYRLSGQRGSVHLLDFQFNQSLPGLRGHSGARTTSIDADELLIEDGRFDVLVSRERPDGYRGDWRHLMPGTGSVLMRQVRYDWANELEASVAIERLDRPIRRDNLSAKQIRERLSALGDYIVSYQRQFLGYKEQVRKLGPSNVLYTRIRHETGGAGQGGGMGGQVIYHGNFALRGDEALLIETEIPARCGYWNIQLTDELHLALDPVFCQSSLNGFQARLDADGRFRAVVTARDPGVPNWLDTKGLETGGIIGRWTHASAAPVPSTRVIKWAQLRDHIPRSTAYVTPEEREQLLRLRCRATQVRKR